MAFQISSYIVNAYIFPFIVTSSRPFARYFLNNIFIPLIFNIFYILYSISFQANEEFLSFGAISFNIFAFLLGNILFIFFSFTYFFSANKDIYKILGTSKEKFAKKRIAKPLDKLIEKDVNWKVDNAPDENEGVWHISYYFYKPFKIKAARDFAHYPMDVIQKTLTQNHKSAAFFSFLIVLFVVLIGIFKEHSFFVIPAAASITIFFSLMILVAAAVYSFLKEWTFIFFIATLLLFNYFSKSDVFSYHETAYGLNYDKSIKSNTKNTADVYGTRKNSKKNLEDILVSWKKKNSKAHKKPKIIFINTAGGGLKAALWSYYALAYADSCLNGELFKHSFLMTGASGGMIGAAFFRAKKQNGKAGDNLLSVSTIDKFSQDMLNPIAFTMVVNDFFFRFSKVSYGGMQYYKDRSLSLEQDIDKNTGSLLNHPISYYKDAEYRSEIPMMILTPSIQNNGGKLLISPQNIACLRPKHLEKEAIDFLNTYKPYSSDSLRFLSALRMNAAFPYITPYIMLPGEKRLRVMDAALHDNYGLSTSLLFMYSFKDWLSKNTSGIIILNVSEDENTGEFSTQSLLSDLFKPFDSVFSNFFNFQRNKHRFMLSLFQQNFLQAIDVVKLQLMNNNKRIPLSWHLTKKEKQLIFKSINTNENKKSIQLLHNLLEQ